MPARALRLGMPACIRPGALPQKTINARKGITISLPATRSLGPVWHPQKTINARKGITIRVIISPSKLIFDNSENNKCPQGHYD
jgi:hypothetical protein